jgi:hypothetical protein
LAFPTILMHKEIVAPATLVECQGEPWPTPAADQVLTY